MPGLDCSQRISGAAVAAAGYQFVFRYLSGWAGNPKNVTRAEIDDLHAHGVAVGLVYEDREYSVTASQAQAAVAMARSLGVPNGVAIFMACDMNPAPPSAMYDMTSAAGVLHPAGFLAGVYGSKALARSLVHRVDASWVVDTWGADLPGDAWNFRQLPNAGRPSVGGVACDVDDAPFPVGLWSPAPAPVPPPVFTPPQEVDVNLTKTMVSIGPLGPDGRGWDVMDGRDPNHPNITFANFWNVFINGSDPTHGGYVQPPVPSENQDSGHVQIELFGAPGTVIGVWFVHSV